MEKEGKQELEGPAEASRRLVIGVGFWVQGFRLFPWLGVNFFLKDGMGVAASSLHILEVSANLPMVANAKLFCLLSDAVPIRYEGIAPALRRHRRYAPSAILFYYPVFSISCLDLEPTSAITNSSRHYSPHNFLGL